MTELALPRYILGRTDFTTRKISLRHEPPGLDLELRESQRLKELFDDCILISYCNCTSNKAKIQSVRLKFVFFCYNK